jgi:hypothetical protein
MPEVGFGPMTPVFEWAKTVHALDRTATVISSDKFGNIKYYFQVILANYECHII